jgi:hypothetical protein
VLRSVLWPRVVGILLFFVLLVFVNRLLPGHTRWAFVVAGLGAYGAVMVVPRLEAGLRRDYAAKVAAQVARRVSAIRGAAFKRHWDR